MGFNSGFKGLSSSCGFLQSPVTSSLLGNRGTNNLKKTKMSNMKLSICVIKSKWCEIFLAVQILEFIRKIFTLPVGSLRLYTRSHSPANWLVSYLTVLGHVVASVRFSYDTQQSVSRRPWRNTEFSELVLSWDAHMDSDWRQIGLAAGSDQMCM